MVPVASVHLEIPDHVLSSLNLPPGEVERELRKELAIALYARGSLSVGKAAEFAEMPRWEFEEQLGDRQVPRHYGEEELKEDLEYGLGDR